MNYTRYISNWTNVCRAQLEGCYWYPTERQISYPVTCWYCKDFSDSRILSNWTSWEALNHTVGPHTLLVAIFTDLLELFQNNIKQQLEKLYWDKQLSGLKSLLPVLVFITIYFGQLLHLRVIQKLYKILGNIKCNINFHTKKLNELFYINGKYLGVFMF
jgi:hypothetical protein